MKINNIGLLKAKNDTAAGLAIMIGTAATLGLIPNTLDAKTKYFNLGKKTADRIDKDLKAMRA